MDSFQIFLISGKTPDCLSGCNPASSDTCCTGQLPCVSYNLARDRITNSALMSDEQLIFQLNSRLNQTENVADTIQYQMYAFEHSSPDQVGTMQALTSMRSNISLYKSTFDFFHIYVFLKPEQTGADEGIYFFFHR